MSEQTAGDWYAEGAHVFDSARRIVAYAGTGTLAQREANMRLMAASKQMQAALKGLSHGGCCCEMRIGNPMMKSHSPQCVAAQEAIAAAEGARL